MKQQKNKLSLHASTSPLKQKIPKQNKKKLWVCRLLILAAGVWS